MITSPVTPSNIPWLRWRRHRGTDEEDIAFADEAPEESDQAPA